MAIDISERGLETLIFDAMNGSGWLPGDANDYDRDHHVDLVQLNAFLNATQPEVATQLSLDSDTRTRHRFLERLSREVARRGVIDALRNGVSHLQHNINLFYSKPTPGNEAAAFLHQRNRFSITRQLRYSSRNRNLSLDLALFVNGLPLITMELKNNLTGQTYKHAIEQYQTDRSPTREPLFRPGRCAAHFALDESQVHFCAELAGKQSVFLPFNKGKGKAGGAGNPVNSDGLRTSYLWEEILRPDSLCDIIENYAYFVDEISGGRKTGKKRSIWPRHHQLDVVRSLVKNVSEHGVGHKYLIQHSAGSGKSNSIAWLSRLLTGLESDGSSMFDSVVVITDRRILDRQIDDTIKQFIQDPSSVEHAEDSDHLRHLLRSRKRIITTTVQKFPFVRDLIGDSHKDRNFAIVIDEAHSGQGGSTAIEMGRVLGNYRVDEVGDYEDAINAAMDSRAHLPNASYFAFTATPKNKTLELFGDPPRQPDDAVKREPFHIYTMKQAIGEGFILDVLTNYTPYRSYYELHKSIEDDPDFDSRRAQRKLRRYVEEHPETVSQKAAVMLDHFESAIWRPKIMGGEARAMIVTEGVNRAIEYYYALKDHIHENDLSYDVVVAFSGEREHNGTQVSEPSLNGFPERETAAEFRSGDHRILVCADKFQTGYDEPLLMAMYVDKPLSGVRAVQTLSRLNRMAPGKREPYILDFANDSDTIKASFDDYYRATILSDETDPNKLHDIKSRLDASGVYTRERVENVNRAFYLYANEIGSAGRRGRNDFDPHLDDCVDRYTDMDEDGQVEFKGGAKAFTRTYSFLSQIMDIRRKEWEELATFLTFLIPKLPSPEEDDLSIGIEQAVDMATYAIEKREAVRIILEDEDAEIDPVPDGPGGQRSDAVLDPLSAIIAEFNRQYRLPGMDEELADRIIRTVPNLVNKNEAYRNAKRNADPENVRVELEEAIKDALLKFADCAAEFFGQYYSDSDFRDWFNREISRVV